MHQPTLLAVSFFSLTLNGLAVIAIPGHTTGRHTMSTRKRAVTNISVPPNTAREYKKIAQAKGESTSRFFMEIFGFYKQESQKKNLRRLQGYGADKAKALKITEREIEKLVFEGR